MKYLFEKGLKILKDNGIFAYICSNKFTKAKYGEKLRKLILKNQLKIYNDFTGVKVFKEASVDTCVIQIKKNYIEENNIFINNHYLMEQNRLDSNSFTFNSPDVLNLRDKILNQGTLIKDLDVQINYGIKTGFNKAFIIDEKTKNKLISEDSKNKEIIKPLLRGRDINKWRISYKNLYIIFTRRGIDINKYPVIKEFLSKYKKELTPKTKDSKRTDVGRKPGPYEWYEIQDNVAYYSLFEEEKLIYPELSSSLSMVYDDNQFYIDKTCFIITTSLNIKYINALLNSNVLNFVFKLLGTPLGKSGFNLSKIYIEQLPIIFTNTSTEKEIKELVDEIIILNNEINNEIINFKKYLKEQNINSISNKLDDYYSLDSKKFINEIKKQHEILLSDTLINELIHKFKNSIKKISNLNSDLKLKEDKLNNIIYKIYNLNENEIKLIEDDLF